MQICQILLRKNVDERALREEANLKLKKKKVEQDLWITM